MKLRMDNFWNTLLVVAIATFIVNMVVQLILVGTFNIGQAMGIAIVLGAIVAALVRFKKIDFS